MGTRTLLFLISAFLFALPAFASECLKCHQPHYVEIASCSSCHRGDESTSRKNIAHSGIIKSKFADFRINEKSAENGRQTIEKAHCRRCHTIGGKGNDIAPNTDTESRRKSPEALLEKITQPSDYMPLFTMPAGTAEDTVKYIIASGEKYETASKTAPYVVFITSGGKSTFEEKCGGCHRLLSRTKGGIGHGDNAPNLSGIFTEFYPIDVLKEKGEKWNRDLLLKWIKNPRSIDSVSLMPPQALTKEEEDKIITELTD